MATIGPEQTIRSLLEARYAGDYACPDDHPDVDDLELSGGRRTFIVHQTEYWKQRFLSKATEILCKVKSEDVHSFLECFDAWARDNKGATWYQRTFTIQDLFRLYEGSGVKAIQLFRQVARTTSRHGPGWGDAVHEGTDGASRCLHMLQDKPAESRLALLQQMFLDTAGSKDAVM